MKIFKSPFFWFTFLVLTGAAVLAFFAPKWGWERTGLFWGLWAGTTILLLLIIAYFRQRALLRRLSNSTSTPHVAEWEEQWKSGFKQDFHLLAGKSGESKRQGSQVVASLAKRKVYLLVGNSGSGMSQALISAGMRPLGTELTSTLTGELSKCCRWWISADSIYLEATSSALTRNDTTDLDPRLAYLVDLLNATGKARALDGVLLFANPFQASKDLELSAKFCRSTLNAIAAETGVELPVYLCTTHLDRVVGSHSFFEAIGPQARNTLLFGIAFPWQKKQDPALLLAEGCRQIEKSLVDSLDPLLLATYKKGHKPADLLRFFDGIRDLQNKISPFAKQALGQFVGKDRIYFRGFYFFSALAGSGPAENQTDAKSKSSNISPASPLDPFAGLADFEDAGSTAPPKTPPPTAPESALHYFLKPFFTFLESEPNLVRLGSQKHVKTSVVATALSFVCLFSAAAIVAAALYSDTLGRNLQQQWKARLHGVLQTPWNTAEDVRTNLQAIEDLRLLIAEMQEERPLLLAPGFYRSAVHLPQAQAWLDSMGLRLTRGALHDWETQLQQSLFLPANQLNATELYGQLQTYLLLSTSGRQLPSGDQEEQVPPALLSIWENYLGISLAELDLTLRDILPNQATWITEKIRRNAPAWMFAENMRTVEQLRRILRDSKFQGANYASLIGCADAMPTLSLDSLGLPAAYLGGTPYEIPAAFTKAGFNGCIQNALQGEKDRKADWVLGETKEDLDKNAGFDKDLRAQLSERYFREYGDHWRSLLESVQINLPADLQRQAMGLQYLASPYQASDRKGLRAFFSRFAEETDLVPQDSAGGPAIPIPGAARGAVQKARTLAATAERFLKKDTDPRMELRQRFTEVHTFADMLNKGRMDTYFANLNILAATVSQASESDEATFDFVKQLFASDRRNKLIHAWSEVEVIYQDLPIQERTWFQSLFRQPLSQIADGIIPLVRQRIARSYGEKVMTPYRTLVRGAYPFDSYATTRQISLDEMGSLLNRRDGGIASFLKEVEGMLELKGNKLRPGSWQGKSLGFSPEALEALERAIDLSNKLYQPNSSTLKAFQITAELPETPRATVGFEINGQSIQVRPGEATKRVTFRWPQPSGSGAKITVQTLNDLFVEEMLGEWGLLRLALSKARPVQSTSMLESLWSFRDRSYIVDVRLSMRVDNASNPFTDPRFFQMELQPDILRQ